jgi:hypothetical protein
MKIPIIIMRQANRNLVVNSESFEFLEDWNLFVKFWQWVHVKENIHHIYYAYAATLR